MIIIIVCENYAGPGLLNFICIIGKSQSIIIYCCQGNSRDVVVIEIRYKSRVPEFESNLFPREEGLCMMQLKNSDQKKN